MKTIEVQGNRLVVKSDPPAKKLTVEERLAALEAENTALKARLTKVEKTQKAASTPA